MKKLDTNTNFLEVFDVGLSCFSDTILPPNNIVNFKKIVDVNIYPNPSNEDFYIKINDNFINNKIEIYNLTGKKYTNNFY